MILRLSLPAPQSEFRSTARLQSISRWRTCVRTNRPFVGTLSRMSAPIATFSKTQVMDGHKSHTHQITAAHALQMLQRIMQSMFSYSLPLEMHQLSRVIYCNPYGCRSSARRVYRSCVWRRRLATERPLAARVSDAVMFQFVFRSICAQLATRITQCCIYARAAVMRSQQRKCHRACVLARTVIILMVGHTHTCVSVTNVCPHAD